MLFVGYDFIHDSIEWLGIICTWRELETKGEAKTNGNERTVFQSLADYVKVKDCLERALVISTLTGHRQKTEATVYVSEMSM